MNDQNMNKIAEIQAETAVKKLREHNFDAVLVDTKEEALSYLQNVIPKGASIGFGGSQTLFEMGAIDWLTGNPDYTVYDRYHTDDVKRVFHDSLSADVYLMSSNAVTLDGKLYNIDGNGNRLAALIYGPEKVYVVCGVNKLVNDLTDAIERVKMVAAPANNVRLNKENPCSRVGKCMECNAPGCICNQFVITRRSGTPGRICVILVKEALGY